MENVIITEVGLRDGLQSEKRILSTDNKLVLLNALIESGIKRFEVTSFVSPKVVPQLADSSELFKALSYKSDELIYTALVPNYKGYQRAVQAGAKSIAIPISATDTMNQKNLNFTFDEAMDFAVSVIEQAKVAGVFVKCYISVAFSCPFEGLTPSERIFKMANVFLKAGGDELVIADTNGSANPAQVHKLFTDLALNSDIGKIAAHFHDTRAMALANVWAALEAGVRKFDTSIGGLGGCPFAPGASGNLATEDLVAMLHQSGFETGVDLHKLRLAVKIAETLVQHPVGGRMTKWFELMERSPVLSH